MQPPYLVISDVSFFLLYDECHHVQAVGTEPKILPNWAFTIVDPLF